TAQGVVNWPRVNAVDDALWKLAQRPALAYRNRKVLDFAAADLAKIEVSRKSESFTLERDKEKKTWKLTRPEPAEVESAKAETLANDLGKLEVVEFVTDEPKKEDLDKVYGL